jgi:hypothetical protein
VTATLHALSMGQLMVYFETDGESVEIILIKRDGLSVMVDPSEMLLIKNKCLELVGSVEIGLSRCAQKKHVEMLRDRGSYGV